MGGGSMVVEQLRHGPVTGMFRDDIVRIGQALTGAVYPTEKWRLIAHATRATPKNDPPYGTDWRTIDQLWALPSGCYRDFNDVLAGLARTARGHPARPGAHRRPTRSHPPQGR
jgi:hypothetical protein